MRAPASGTGCGRWITLDELPDDLVPASVREPAGPPARRSSLPSRRAATDPAAPLGHPDRQPAPAGPRAGSCSWTGAPPRSVPRWVDPLLARLERVDQPWFDASLGASPALAEVGDDLVTGWLVAFGTHLAWRSLQGSADIGLPTLNEFRRTEARRFLGAAARRMRVSGPDVHRARVSRRVAQFLASLGSEPTLLNLPTYSEAERARPPGREFGQVRGPLVTLSLASAAVLARTPSC